MYEYNRNLPDKKVIEACLAASNNSEVVNVASFNAPGQAIISGNIAAVNKAIKITTKMGAKRTIILPISVPSHCKLMVNASNHLKPILKSIKWNLPNIPVIHNYDVTYHNTIKNIHSSLIKQLYNPVRWTEIIKYFVDNNISHIIECGPGKVLTGL